MLTTEDPCQHDVSDCLKVEPGRTCKLRCKVPFFGTETIGYCLATNTKDGGLVLKLPTCSIGSGWDPMPVLSGYMRTSRGWACAPGFSGSLVLQCDVLENCATEIMPTGCGPVLPCGIEPFNDEDTRFGFLNGTIKFGPAQLGDNVSEGAVESYVVYFADDCNHTIGEELAVVNISGDDPACCISDGYSVRVNASIPTGSDHLVVIARTSSVSVTPQERHGMVVPFKDFWVRPKESHAARWRAAVAAWVLPVLAGRAFAME